MAPWKAPVPDGFPPRFYQHFWEVLKHDVYQFIQGVCNDHIKLEPFNSMLITLIPKAKNPSFPSDWRPISLHNTSYKILTKLICSRLQPLLPKLTDPTQGAFIKGRGCIDNAYVALEVIHSILTKDKRLS